MDQEVYQLVCQLMFGNAHAQDRAYDELGARGIPATWLEEWKQRGAFKKDALLAAPTDQTRVITAQPISEPYFAWNERKTRKMAFPRPQHSLYNDRRNRKRPAPGLGTQSAGAIGRHASENVIPLSTIGLALTGIGSEYKLKVNNFDTFKKASKNGKFVANWNGQRVWKLNFFGNQFVSSEAVAAQKAAFNSTYKTLKLVKSAGRVSTIMGGVLSVAEGVSKNTVASYSKTTLDLIMTGVAFMGPAGVTVSGVYFVYTGALSLHSGDWWEVFWENYLTDPKNFAREAIETFDKADRAHRQITGRGLLQGSKL